MVLIRWAVVLLVAAVLAALFGFTGAAQGMANVALFLFFLFLAGFVLLLVLGIVAIRKIT